MKKNRKHQRISGKLKGTASQNVEFPWYHFQPNLNMTKGEFKISDDMWERIKASQIFQAGFIIGWNVESIELRKVFKIWDETMVILGRR